jgi:hypothetical protein
VLEFGSVAIQSLAETAVSSSLIVPGPFR